MFAPKGGGGSSSGRGRVERRRRESGASFGERAYKRAAEREAEKAAEKAGKGGRGGLTDEQRAQREKERQEDRAYKLSERKRREEERIAREAERKAKEEERRQKQIDLANHKYKDSRIPPGFARKMVDAMHATPQAGISDVKDALNVDPEKVGTLPFSGPEKIAFIDYLKERMPASRLQVEEDGSGWYLDNTGRLYRIPGDDDYVKNG